MTESAKKKLNKQMVEVSADYALWASGSDRPWEHDAIVGADFLKRLTELAAKAPRADVLEFIAWVKGVEP
jgi:hypothetical protein